MDVGSSVLLLVSASRVVVGIALEVEASAVVDSDDVVTSPVVVAVLKELVGVPVEVEMDVSSSVLLLVSAKGFVVGVALEVEASAVVDDVVNSPDVVAVAMLKEVSGGRVKVDVDSSVLLLKPTKGFVVGVALEVNSPDIVAAAVLQEVSGG